jgi:hypothetical protein
MRRAALLVFLLPACDCGDQRACSDCPPLEGRYAMAYDDETASADCSAIRPPAEPAELELSRVGSTARTTVAGVELSGTVFDSFTFSLTGNGAGDGGQLSMNLRGTFVPPSSVTDGGTQLRGTYSADITGGGKSCSTSRGYVGVKK